MNVIRETVRVVKEQIENDPEYRNKCGDKDYRKGIVGQGIISEYLGGPWVQKYQKNLIAEALAQLRDIEDEIVSEKHHGEGKDKGLGEIVPLASPRGLLDVSWGQRKGV